MHLLRSDRFPAVILLAAAALGLVVANSPAGADVDAAMHLVVGIPGVLTLSIAHWITDALLAIFFFTVAVELQFELTAGELRSARRATQPAIAAAGGVLVPIAIYLAVARGGTSAAGWPVPTATDVAFALGLLAVFGRGLPSAVRVFLLALAILDDIVGIVFIAVLFTADIDGVMLLAAAACVVLFGILSRIDPLRRAGAAPGAGDGRSRGLRPVVIRIALVGTAIVTWACVYASGVHATIAGVALGLAMAQQPALRARHVLEPWVNGLILPVFAFSAALVAIPAVSPTRLQPAFWGVALALPLGKLVGISVFGWLALRIGRERGAASPMPFADLLAAGALGGIGFTVSLLLADLSFAGQPLLRDEATLGVLAGSAVALVLAVAMVSWRARHYRRRVRSEPA